MRRPSYRKDDRSKPQGALFEHLNCSPGLDDNKSGLPAAAACLCGADVPVPDLGRCTVIASPEFWLWRTSSAPETGRSDRAPSCTKIARSTTTASIPKTCRPGEAAAA